MFSPSQDAKAERPRQATYEDANLLLRLYDSFYKKDVAGAKALLADLERHGAEAPELQAARGLFAFQAGRYGEAYEALDDPTQAEAAYRAARAVDPNYAPAVQAVDRLSRRTE